MKTKESTRITRLLGTLFVVAGLAAGACTSEVTDDVVPPTEMDTGRREVLLTLKNKLTLPGSTTRGIATAAENELSTLDVYVFGSETEAGTYTFQECFSYRGEDAGDIPAKSTLLPLAADMADNSKTTGLLGLKKGLFVKLYCVANAPKLVDPVTGNLLDADDFSGLKLREGAAGTTPALQIPGIPTEADFLTYHTPVLTEAVGTDVLVTPLAMSGAYTIPLDLTAPEGATRLSIGFKLTRLVSRFDVVNNAAESHFTIQSISMGKGRRGATFFPIEVCDAQATVTPDKLITYPEHLFDGAQANLGLQPGAFYTYASPLADAGYLILKGLYHVNATEQKEVSYQVPFRQLGADGKESFLEIQHNHRYTIGITKADEYHLDFNLKVEDWADDGSVDDYVPETKPGEITLGNKDANTEYELDPTGKKHTVKMSLVAGSTFEAKLNATGSLQVTKNYAGGQAGQQYDWLQIGQPVTTFATIQNGQMEYTYNFTLTPGYTKGRFPRATIRFFDPISGNENILYVEAISAPTPVESTQPSKAPNGTSDNPNSVDLDRQEVSLYRITNSQGNVTVSCADEVELESSPIWLTVTNIKEQQTNTTYSIVLNDRDVAATTGKVIFRNKNKPQLKTEYTVNLLEALIQPKFDNLGTGNAFIQDASGTTLGDLAINVAAGNKATVVTTPIDGVTTQIDFDGGPEWLISSAPVTRVVMGQQQEIIFSLREGKLAGAKKATVTLINKIGGKNEVFTISPKLNVGNIEKVSSIPTDNALSGTNMTLYKLPIAGSEMKLKVTSYGGSTLTVDNESIVELAKTTATRASSETQDEVVSYYTLTPKSFGTTKLTLANRTDPTKETEYAITVVDPAITISGGESKSLTVQNNQSISFSANSPKGFTVTPSYGTTRWINSITKTDYAGGTTSIAVSTPSTGTVTDSATPKNITITLKNKIKDGGDKVLTVTPNIITPSFSKGSISLSNIINETGGQSQTNSVTSSSSYTYSVVSNDASIATVSISGTTITVNAKKKGTATITVRTTSGASYTNTFTVTVVRSYEGQGVYRSVKGNYYIASGNAYSGKWVDNINNYCSNKSGASWRTPSRSDIYGLLGVSGPNQNATSSVANAYTDMGVFTWGYNYHTTDRVWENDSWKYYYFDTTSGSMTVLGISYIPSANVRCITNM